MKYTLVTALQLSRLFVGFFPHQRQEVQKLLHIMLNEGVDQPSKSPSASLFMLVLKKDNGFLFCIDYYKLLRLLIKMTTH